MPVYKDETTGKYYCKFYYRDWQGNNKQKMKKGFKKQKEAKEFEKKFLDKAHADCNMTFNSLYEIYMEDAKVRLKPTTYENKRVLIELKILPFFKNQRISDITSKMVKDWQTNLMKQGYKPTYLKTIHNQLTAMFNYAMKFYKLQENPARTCGSMGSKNADPKEIWTTEKFNEFIGAFDEKPIYRAAFNILFWTGIRSGELLALTLNDIDFEKKTISINKNFAKVNGKELTLKPKTPKSKRVVTIHDFLIDEIKMYIKHLYDYEPHQRLFNITKSALNTQMNSTIKKLGLKKIHVHALRHSHASLLIELGFSPLLIAERLGHEKVQTTLETYAHLYPNKQNEVTAKIQAMISDENQNIE